MREPQKILVTGSNGFIGTALTSALLDRGFQVRMAGTECAPQPLTVGAEWVPMPDLSKPIDWTPLLEGIDSVVHLAGIAHRMESSSPNDWAIYDQVNHQGTRSLAMALRQHPSVRRFIFLSSVRVHGDPQTLPVRVDSPLAPTTPYDLSKMMAEKAIRELLASDSISWAILRPVLVYGPGNRGNMARLEKLLRAGIPLPVGWHENKRSFLYIENLISIIERYLVLPNPPSSRSWIVADENATSTERLFKIMGSAMGLKARVVHVPDWLLSVLSKIGDCCQRIGLPSPWNTGIQHKLLGDFFVDIAPAMLDLTWKPPFNIDDGLKKTYGKF